MGMGVGVGMGVGWLARRAEAGRPGTVRVEGHVWVRKAQVRGSGGGGVGFRTPGMPWTSRGLQRA